MKKLILFSVLMMFTSSCFSQTQQWFASYHNPGFALYQLENTVIDNSGNSYITGQKFLTSVLSLPSQYLAKYNSLGNLQWNKYINPPYPGPNNKGSRSKTSALDNSGNIYIAGYTDSAFGTFKGYIMKYSPAGDSLWGNYAGINDTLRYVKWIAMKIDNNGNIYVAGFRYITNQNKSFLIAKYNSSGVLQWMRSPQPSALYDIFEYNFKIILDNSNNVFVSTTIQKNSLDDSYDIYTVKYNSTGVLQWSFTYDGPASSYDEFSSMACDGAGDLYIEGFGTFLSPDNKEIICIKLNGSNGAQQWLYKTRGNASSNGDYSYNLAVGYSNDVYLTCSFDESGAESLDGTFIKLNASNGLESWRRYLVSQTAGSYEKYFMIQLLLPKILLYMLQEMI